MDDRPELGDFCLGAKYYMKQMPYGCTKCIATKMKIKPNYLSDLIGGRKTWTRKMIDSFCKHSGVHFQDVLTKGRENNFLT